MVEISDWLWQGLYVLKKLYDHGRADAILEEFEELKLNGDYIGDIAMQSIYEVFAETRDYWDSYCDVDIYVFFDPVFNEFHRLCCEYEKKKGVSHDKNPHREEIRRAIQSGLQFYDYSYDFLYYDGSQRDGQSKLILKLYPDFGMIYEVAGGLLEVYDAFESHVKRLKEELGVAGEPKIHELPPAVEQAEKEAA